MHASSYFGLFLAAFGAATLLPLQSEAVLVDLLVVSELPASSLVAVAIAGNVLWVGGQLGAGSKHRWRHKRWFPVGEHQLARAQRAYHRFGRWLLLLSWMPIIGDPLTLVAGVMREPLWSFVLIVLVAKSARYLALAAATLQMLE